MLTCVRAWSVRCARADVKRWIELDVAEWAAQRCRVEVQEWVEREDVPLLVLEWLQGKALGSDMKLAARGAVPKGKGGIRVSPPMTVDELLKQLMEAKEELQRLSEQAVAGVHAREHACACVSVRVSVASLRSARLLTRAAAPCAANSEFIYLST